MNQHLNWFAVRVRPNFEQPVFRALQAKGLEAFVPTFRERRTWSDRIKVIDSPLFPEYLFCRAHGSHKLQIVSTPAVQHLVGFGNGPIAIPEAEISAVRRLMESKLPIQPWPFLKRGQTVVVEKGPLTGLEGALVDFRGEYRVVVSVSLLQRSIAAEVDVCWIRPTNPQKKTA